MPHTGYTIISASRAKRHLTPVSFVLQLLTRRHLTRRRPFRCPVSSPRRIAVAISGPPKHGAGLKSSGERKRPTTRVSLMRAKNSGEWLICAQQRFFSPINLRPESPTTINYKSDCRSYPIRVFSVRLGGLVCFAVELSDWSHWLLSLLVSVSKYLPY